ncbi:hypothetical protein BZA05DRAFT_59778 [Tricharina praecox]|uniref:uncharacterized protein n=1 Tax=Tricharina praecox TaxID=43433 RepID=UPI002220ACD2|nr:uncharacterized protein BZA05DRAFT_59778 [Tricharina praecox]KAI5850651.1 hypothetical protein BZA05DRAFT_59778 [Tricharina praecox]
MACTPARTLSPATTSDQEAITQLEKDFPKLDGALIAPIYYDTRCVATARATLEILYVTIDDEASSGGSGGISPANSCPEWGEGGGDWTSESDPTTGSLASLNLGFDEEEEEEEEEGDVGHLRMMFPTMSRFSLENALRKASGDLERATDELLNRVSLEEDGETGKGIDGFGEEVMFQRKKRKGKGRATAPGLQRRMSLPPEGTENTPVAQRVSVWDKKNEEIGYISTCLGIPKTVVASTHHANGGSVPRTIATLLDAHGGEAVADGEEHLAELNELVQEFGGEVKAEYLDRLLRLCKDNKIAVFQFGEQLRRGSLAVLGLRQVSAASSPRKPAPARSGPTRLTHDDGSTWTVIGTSLQATQATSPTYHRPLNYATSAQLAGVYRHARNEAFQKAAASHRRSKSDRLMGGVAAVYADQGHEYHARTKEYENRAAEQYVIENSGDGVLDLHGVTVSQAVKIANERTTRWWAEAQPDAYGRGFQPFRIVTGMGRHSANGEAKLTPAVSKMLQRGGWKIGVGRGEILVYGVQK